MHSPFKEPHSPVHPEDTESLHWEKYGFNFGNWDEKKIWKIELPPAEMATSEFEWHLDVPYWDSDDGQKFTITPRDVLDKKLGATQHQKRVSEVDMDYPIDIMFHEGKWFILDGVHRLARALQEEKRIMNVRIFPSDRLEEIR
jgi:hypothetical protein